MVSLLYRKKVMTTGLAILAIVIALTLVTASSSGLVTSAFAVKKGSSGKSDTSSSSDKSGSSTSKKGTSGTSGGTSTGSKSKFIKCVTAISGSSPSRAEVDSCWDQVFGGGSGLTLGGSSGSSTSGGSSSASSNTGSGSSGHGGASTSLSST
jgi:hypothetical protein